MKDITVGESIITWLAKGPENTTDLIKNIIREHGVTKEAAYKALRVLRDEEIAVKSGRTTSLSNQWVIDMADKWKKAETRYVGTEHKQFLTEKNSVVYTCKTLDQLDALWNHNIYELTSKMPKGSSLMSCVPHYWFPAIRSESEHSLMKNMKARGFVSLQLASTREKLDVDLQKYFPYKEIQYFAAELPEKNYINILGDHLIEVTLDRKANNAINEWYETHTKFDTESIALLEKVLQIKGIYKLKISRNKKRAEKYHTLFKKYFVMK